MSLCRRRGRVRAVLRSWIQEGLRGTGAENRRLPIACLCRCRSLAARSGLPCAVVGVFKGVTGHVFVRLEYAFVRIFQPLYFGHDGKTVEDRVTPKP